MAEHTFLLLEALWRTEGEFFDGTGNRAEVEGEAAIRHYPDKWIYEGTLRSGSLDNAIVLGKRGPLNGLRYPDEFVRHKILDLIGDLALLGRAVVGHVSAFNAGHALNLELVSG